MQFSSITVLSFSCFAFIGGLASYSLFTINENDLKKYHTLMDRTDPSLQDSPYTARQQHGHVRKEIWFVHKGQRLQLKLCSKEAELVLDRQMNKTEVMEQLQHVVCHMQEELFYRLIDGREITISPSGVIFLRGHPEQELNIKGLKIQPMQVIRTFKANEAIYHYSNDSLTANQVHISRFVAPGHELNDSFFGPKMLMDGIADRIELSLANENPDFTAHGLKARFSLSEGS